MGTKHIKGLNERRNEDETSFSAILKRINGILYGIKALRTFQDYRTLVSENIMVGWRQKHVVTDYDVLSPEDLSRPYGGDSIGHVRFSSLP